MSMSISEVGQTPFCKFGLFDTFQSVATAFRKVVQCLERTHEWGYYSVSDSDDTSRFEQCYMVLSCQPA